MTDRGFELDVFRDLLEESGVVGELAKDQKLFLAAFTAFRSANRSEFQDVLKRLNLSQRCHLVGKWMHSKEVIFCVSSCAARRSQSISHRTRAFLQTPLRA